jgi:hypothetical protein
MTLDNQAQITSWNRFSKRFINPPIFTLLPRPAATKYWATIDQSGNTFTVESIQPRIDLGTIWATLQHAPFELTISVIGDQGVLGSIQSRRIKSAGWKGFDQTDLNWTESADRCIGWLIASAERGVAPYREPGVPVWVWSSAGPEPKHPAGRGDAYPAAHLPVFIRGFLAHADAGRGQAEQAMRLANVCGEWLLAHRNPDSGKLPLFPFSTIGGGQYGGGYDGQSVNLPRASVTAAGLVRLYEATRRKELLEYASDIADVTMRFQRHDGSLPYRVDPATGAITEDYTCHAIDFVALAAELAPYRSDPALAYAAQRALDWMIAYPVATHHWQAAFEDVGEKVPYENLENMPAMELMRQLCRRANQNPAYVSIARQVNRWVEDQFVIFEPDECASLPVPVPQVMEQYHCWHPMEGHTANWVLALIELHKATGEREYLDKARAAANAICASQFPSGEFSTWGHDPKTGRRGNDGMANWYAASAFACWGLYELASYVRRHA